MLLALWTLIVALLAGYAMLLTSMYPDRNQFTRFLMSWWDRRPSFGIGRIDPRRGGLIVGILIIIFGIVQFVSYFVDSNGSDDKPTGDATFFLLIAVAMLAVFLLSRTDRHTPMAKTSAEEVTRFRKYNWILALVICVVAVLLYYWTKMIR